MRILVVSNIYPPVIRGGYEVECASVVGLLQDRGDDVHVLTSRAAVAASPSVTRALHWTPNYGKSLWLAPLTTISDRRSTHGCLRAFRPDLVFVWNGAFVPHATIYDILSSGVPTAFRVCEHWFGGLFSADAYMRYLPPGGSRKRRAWSNVIRAANRLPPLGLESSVSADIAISWVSSFLRQALPVPHGLKPRLERVVHPTTRHAARFEALERKPSSRPVIAFVGRLTPEKGADVAIAALGQLTRDGHDAELALAGGGSTADHERLQEASRVAGVTDRCAFLGQLETGEVCRLLERSTILVIPSVWEEPLPITIIEGALARIPIVASRVGGIPEAMTAEEALLTAPGDSAELANALGDVLRGPMDAEERAARAFVRAKEFSWDAYSAATREFVDDAARELA